MLILTQSQIRDIITRQRQFFASGETQSLDFRLEQLHRLKRAILDNKALIVEAVYKDFKKPEFEAYVGELGVIRQIDYALKNIKYWVQPKTVARPLDQFPSVARIYPEPLGVVLIVSPWNYPFSLTISPLIGAIAAGNCVILKPSEVAPCSSGLIANIIGKTFPPSYISAVEGGVEVSQELLAQKFDHIFFTGGTNVGKIVMEAAAKHLTPVTLELGGKSPCIVEADIDIATACQRIVWGKFINAGQTCIAPDYLLVNRKIKKELLAGIGRTIAEFYGENPARSPDYARIISDKHFARLRDLLQDGEIVMGGQTDASDRYISPTILDSVSLDSRIMQEEIFGPILPVLEYDKLDDAIKIVNDRPKPLALYLFSKNKEKQQQVLRQTSSGGVCLNDTIMHLEVNELPFGGVGESGLGSYHGKASFDTFSHPKSVLEKTFLFPLKLLYPPYKNKMGLIKKLMGG